ncbi:MAG: HNH endonuclease signature motif containing protein, partial [Jatrophihabitantaceae bacterium]
TGADQAPGELEGYGPITAEMALRLANDPTGTWHRIITDTAGRMLDYPVCTYKPPAALVQHVITRDQHCVHPGCRRKATNCHLDHRVPYPAGPTSAANLQPLCKRHHMMKHHSDWHVTKNDDGSYDWTSPTKHAYRYRPPELPTPTEEPPPEPVIDYRPPPF